MHNQPTSQTLTLHRPHVQSIFWALAVGLFGVIDITSTMYFVATTPAVESHPLIAAAIEVTGLWILIPWKAAAFALFYGLYRVVPREWRVGVPIGLTLLGGAVTVWNLHIGLFGATLF